MSNADMDAVICNADTRNAQCRHQPNSYAPYYKSMEMCMPSWACCTCIPSLQSYFCSLTVWELRLEKLRDTATSQLCIFFQMTGMWQWHRLTASCKMFASSIRSSGPDLEIVARQVYIKIIFCWHGAIKYADIKRIHLIKMLEMLPSVLMNFTILLFGNWHDAKTLVTRNRQKRMSGLVTG